MTQTTPARCFVVARRDNVATMLDDLGGPGAVRVLGAAEAGELRVVEAVRIGHKVALRPLAEGEEVVKFGVPIGRATGAIAAGQWVHLHNLASGVDERSQTLDLHTGSATDTRYG